MRMDKKLMLLFSLLMIVVTFGNTVYTYQNSMELLRVNTYDTLSALGHKMLGEIEQSIQLFDYAIDELYTNVDFMNAMDAASKEEDSWNLNDQVSMQTVMSHFLYQEPLLENFYRVSVYSPNGFFLSNHFEKTETVVSLSDEAKDLVASLPYLKQVNAAPFLRHIIGPHPDPWSTARSEIVFSAVKAVYWHGRPIGYIEVSSALDELVEIFYVRELEGMTAHAQFSDGRELFRFMGDDVRYENLPENEIAEYKLEDGSERFALRLHSKSLNLDVFVAQDIAQYRKTAQRQIMPQIAVSACTLLIGIVFIIFISRGLTTSIRSLTKKMRRLPSEHLFDAAGDETRFVTRPFDSEIYEMEGVFNELLMRLSESARSEMALQQSMIKAQLNALQTQINPHFVYNTLNIISAKGMECGNEEIIDLCGQFAQMLRYAADLSSRTATLDMETLNARRYLTLAKARYEDQLEYSIDMPQEASKLLIPKLSLQPLIENALTHGFSGASDKRLIRLTGVLRDGALTLTLRDNGNGFSEETLARMERAFNDIDRAPNDYSDPADGHIGLINTYLRLRFYSHGKIRMSLHNDGGAVVTLIIPIEKEQ